MSHSLLQHPDQIDPDLDSQLGPQNCHYSILLVLYIYNSGVEHRHFGERGPNDYNHTRSSGSVRNQLYSCYCAQKSLMEACQLGEIPSIDECHLSTLLLTTFVRWMVVTRNP